MRILPVAIGFVVLGGAAGVAVPAVEPSTQRPVLTVVSDDPITVAGRGFRRSERVTLRASVGGSTYTRRMRAGRTGRFTARFAGVGANCRPFAVTAVGRGGSRATTRLVIPPPCGILVQP